MPTTDEIFDYVINTPDNTNPAILRGMLDSLEGGGGSGPLVVTITEEGLGLKVMDKNYNEITAANGNVIFRTPGESGIWYSNIVSTTFNEFQYNVSIFDNFNGLETYIAANPTDLLTRSVSPK